MDLERLARDWEDNPCLQHCAFARVEDLAEYLVQAHRYLMSQESGPAGYLYQAQVRRVRELTGEKQK